MSVEKVEVQGWKGKDQVELSQVPKGYLLICHRKSKETGEIIEEEHLVLKPRVDALREIISHCALNVEYKYKWLIRKIIEKYGIHALEGKTVEDMVECFNGGKYRAKWYFPFYYYPLKCLEAKEEVSYFGRGGFIKK